MDTTRQFVVKRRSKVGGICLILLLALLASVGSWWVIGNMETPSVAVESEDMTPDERQAAEGRDESERDDEYIDAYKVADDLPRVLTIEAIDVRARVLPMGVNPDNSMQAPINVFDSGWYTGSAKPGSEGAVVIDAHASGPTREGLFAYLDTLQIGDRMSLERGDGTVFSYEVVYLETVPLEEVDMRKLLSTYDGVEEGLNLITCAGQWLEGQSTYDQRVMVYTKQIDSTSTH